MTTDREALFQHLRTVLVEMFDVDETRVVPDARLYEDLDIDSIDAVDLVAQLKEVTGTRMRPEDFKSVRTVQDAVDATVKLL